MKSLLDRLPVIVGFAEVSPSTGHSAPAAEPLASIAAALQAAARDAGLPSLKEIDSLDVVAVSLGRSPDFLDRLCRQFEIAPHRIGDVASDDNATLRLLHEAALRIWCGESAMAAITGAGKIGFDDDGSALPVPSSATSMFPLYAGGFGSANPEAIYGLYENAALAHWGQTPLQALEESAHLRSGFSQVAAANPDALLERPITAAEIIGTNFWRRSRARKCQGITNVTASATRGAALIVTSLSQAQMLGIPEDRLVYIWCGASASDREEFLLRDQFHRSPGQEAVLGHLMERIGRLDRFDIVELNTASPIVAKMARRTLALPEGARLTVAGGQDFFGVPKSNYMSHATAHLVKTLRQDPNALALLYSQSEYFTHHYAIALSSRPPQHTLLQCEDRVQESVSRRLAPLPHLTRSYEGPSIVETFVVATDNDDRLCESAVILRTPGGERTWARVSADDHVSIRHLRSMERSPVGTRGNVIKASCGELRWRLME